MMEDENIRQILLKKLLREDLTGPEKQALDEWLRHPGNKDLYEDSVQNRKLLEIAHRTLDVNEPRLDRKMRQALLPTPQKKPNRKMITWLAAASVTLLLISGGFLYRHRLRPNSPDRLARIADVMPATNRARLKLSNGNIVYLDSTRNGNIATQGSVTVTKKADVLSYASSSVTNKDQDKNDINKVNELIVPRGGQFQLKLPDGTQVWLNSATDISYPVAFGMERRVKVNGEAFFDVASDPGRPFIVETPHGATQVLGTTFNLNAYEEDSVEMITVLTGKVRVTTPSKSLTLHPGDQAFEKAEALSLEHPNLQAITAWRRGFFYFQNADVQNIMRQLCRFYDVTVQYDGQPSTETYDGLISRDLKLSEALSLLNKLNIKATLTDKTITVAPSTPHQ